MVEPRTTWRERLTGLGPGGRAGRRPPRPVLVGVVVADLANPFFADVVAGCRSAAAGAGWRLVVGDSAGRPDLETQHLRGFESGGVRGVLLAPVGEVPDQAGRLQRRGVPVVVVDRGADEPGFCTVAVDDVEGGRLAMGHLTERQHREVAFVGGHAGPDGLQQMRDRLLGARLAGAGLGEQVRLRTVLTSALDVPAGLEAVETLLALPARDRPTAVFAANDLLALGLLQGFTAAGLQVPGDVALVGYDDIDLAAAAPVALSSVRQPRHALGQRAVELLRRELEVGADGSGHHHEQVRFVPEMVPRASSAARAGRAG